MTMTIEIPPAFGDAFVQAFDDLDAEDERSGVVPLAALRLTRDGFTDADSDAGLLAVLEGGGYVLVEVAGYRPSRMILAGALEVGGREWYWCTRWPSWGRGWKGGAA